jgi:hypothetical protein
MELLDVYASGRTIRADFLFTGLAKGARAYSVRTSEESTYFFDGAAKKYKVSSGSAIVGEYPTYVRLPDGVPSRQWISFEAADAAASEAPQGDLKSGHFFFGVSGDCTALATFRNVPVRR